MLKLITVYTQAYNVEKYMEQCIKSVMAQTYQNFEWMEPGKLYGSMHNWTVG